MSVKLKLTFVYTTVMALTLVVAGWISVALLSFGLSHNLSESLRTDFDRAKAVILLNPDNDLIDILEEMESQIPGSVFIYDSESETLLGNPLVAVDIRPSLTGFIYLGTGIQLREGLDGQIRMGIGQYDKSDPAKFLVVTRDSGYVESTLEEYRNVLFAAIPLALVVSGISGFFLAHNSLRQVRVIRETADKIDPAKLEDRIPVKHKDELGRLSGTLNTLFDRIHGFINRQYRFTGNASHDLTSPLTVIKAETDLALMKERQPEEYRQALNVISGQVGRMRLIVEDLLTLAGLDAGPRPAKSSESELTKLAEKAVNGWQALAANKDIDLTAEIKPGISIYGEPEQFDRLLDNLLSNAVKYTPPGGRINFMLERRNGEIIISVTDTGIGISPEHLPHLGERFYRIDRRVEGTGLGLSIVQGTAQIYRGKLEVESKPGKGSTFRIVLPDGNGKL